MSAIPPGSRERVATDDSTVRRDGRRHHSIAASLALFTILILGATASDIGLTWDEPIYMTASESYVQWLGELVSHPGYALSTGGIEQYWEINHEHPPLDKLWTGLVWSASRGLLDDITAHRLGNIILSGLLVALVYLQLALDLGTLAGLAGALSLLTMPRFFFHAHLAALDVPTALGIFLVTWLFWRNRNSFGWKAILVLGLSFGLAVATKINALFEIPVILGLWGLMFQRRVGLFARLLLAGLIGVAVFVLLWPWLYHDTFSRIYGYVDFMTLNHYQIDQWYRGRNYLPPPWHFPFIMALAVLPLSLTILSMVGTLRGVHKPETREFTGLAVIGALLPLLILATGKAQVFDDERLLMPAFPYLAVLAGLGFYFIARIIRKITVGQRRAAWGVALALLGLAGFGPQTALAASYYPHLLSYYSETVEGLAGATALGLETTYWAESYNDSLSYLNTHAEPGALVWAEAHDVMLYYQRVGRLRSDIRIASLHGSESIVKGRPGYTLPISNADYAVIEYRQSGLYSDITQWRSTRKPLYVLEREHIPVMAIYAR